MHERHGQLQIPAESFLREDRLLGFALTDWSEWCLAALLVSAIGIHLLILVEEQHLLRQFGDTYRQFCDRVPRYFRLSPHRVPE
jgi:protein-S-isoprenylcysteine O-methyltransferase Ste14